VLALQLVWTSCVPIRFEVMVGIHAAIYIVVDIKEMVMKNKSLKNYIARGIFLDQREIYIHFVPRCLYYF
jgi:hypothetical protein